MSSYICFFQLEDAIKSACWDRSTNFEAAKLYELLKAILEQVPKDKLSPLCAELQQGAAVQDLLLTRYAYMRFKRRTWEALLCNGLLEPQLIADKDTITPEFLDWLEAEKIEHPRQADCLLTYGAIPPEVRPPEPLFNLFMQRCHSHQQLHTCYDVLKQQWGCPVIQENKRASRQQDKARGRHPRRVFHDEGKLQQLGASEASVSECYSALSQTITRIIGTLWFLVPNFPAQNLWFWYSQGSSQITVDQEALPDHVDHPGQLHVIDSDRPDKVQAALGRSALWSVLQEEKRVERAMPNVPAYVERPQAALPHYAVDVVYAPAVCNGTKRKWVPNIPWLYNDFGRKRKHSPAVKQLIQNVRGLGSQIAEYCSNHGVRKAIFGTFVCTWLAEFRDDQMFISGPCKYNSVYPTLAQVVYYQCMQGILQVEAAMEEVIRGPQLVSRLITMTQEEHDAQLQGPLAQQQPAPRYRFRVRRVRLA